MSPHHVGLAILVAMLYAICFAAIKAGLAYAPPFRFAAARAAIGSATLFGMLFLCDQRLLPARRLWGPTIALAVIGPVIGFSAMFNSPLYTGAGIAAVLGNMSPLFVLAFGGFWLGEPITRGKLMALLGGLGGAAVIAWPGPGAVATAAPVAIGIPLTAALSGAAVTIIVKLVRPGRDVIQMAAWQFLLASVALAGIASWREPHRPITWTGSFTAIVLVLGGGTSAAATGIWYGLTRAEEIGRLSLMLFLVPVAGLALGAAAFGERMGPLQLAGIGLILGGLGVAAFERQRTVDEAIRGVAAGRSLRRASAAPQVTHPICGHPGEFEEHLMADDQRAMRGGSAVSAGRTIPADGLSEAENAGSRERPA